MSTLLDAANVALFIGIGIGLVLKYRQTRNAGFLWFVLPMVLFPLVSLPIAHWITTSVDGLAAGQINNKFPLSLVESGRMSLGSLLALWHGLSHVIWSAFVLFGLYMLEQRRRRSRNNPADITGTLTPLARRNLM